MVRLRRNLLPPVLNAQAGLVFRFSTTAGRIRGRPQEENHDEIPPPLSSWNRRPQIGTAKSEHKTMTLRLPHWKWFLFVTIPLVVVAVIMPFALPIYGQHVAIREIERLKGIVTTEKGGPEWLRAWLGDETMRVWDDVTEVNLAMTDISDDGLRHVAAFKNLARLNLSRTKVTDAGIEKLKGLTRLEWLSLPDTRITDTGMEHLKGLERLRLLTVERTKVTDAGVNELKAALPKLVVETKTRQFGTHFGGGGLF